MRSKLAGLRLIEQWGLPHPDWRLGHAPDLLIMRPWREAPYGWTVRTALDCATVMPGDENELPFANMAPWDRIADIVRDFLTDGRGPLVFIVYPSWQFKVSGCILVAGDTIHLEVVAGSLAKLTSGRSDPEARLAFSRWAPYACSLRTDAKGLAQLGHAGLFREYFEVLSLYDGLAEWTRTQQGELFFHQWDVLS